MTGGTPLSFMGRGWDIMILHPSIHKLSCTIKNRPFPSVNGASLWNAVESIYSDLDNRFYFFHMYKR